MKRYNGKIMTSCTAQLVNATEKKEYQGAIRHTYNCSQTRTHALSSLTDLFKLLAVTTMDEPRLAAVALLKAPINTAGDKPPLFVVVLLKRTALWQRTRVKAYTTYFFIVQIGLPVIRQVSPRTTALPVIER